MAAKKKTNSTNNNLNRALQAVINKGIKTIKTGLTKEAVNKWAIAKEMYNLYMNIPWQMTKYKSFAKFTEQEFKMSYNSSYVYRTAGEYVATMGYTDKELAKLSAVFSFQSLYDIFKSLNGKKMAVATIIKKFKSYTGGYNKTIHKGKIMIFNSFNFILDDAHAKKLEDLLEHHGMVKSGKGRRTGMSEAMADYLDTL